MLHCNTFFVSNAITVHFTHWSIRLALKTTARYTYFKNTTITIDQGCIRCMFIIYDICYRAMNSTYVWL